MSNKTQAWAWQQYGISAPAKLVLVAIADHADDAGIAWPGSRGLSTKCNLSRTTIWKHLDTLEKSGLLCREKRQSPTDNRRESNRYYLHVNVACTNCNFQAVHDNPSLQGGDNTGLQGMTTRVYSPCKDGFTAPINPGVPEPSLEPSLEPPENHHIEPSVGQSPKKTTLVDQEFRQAMKERFATLTDIDERIDEALGHKAALKYHDQQAYVRGWLRRDSKAGNGTQNSAPAPPARRGATRQEIVKDWRDFPETF